MRIEFFKKKLAHAYLVRRIFLSLLAGKVREIEHSSAVLIVMQMFAHVQKEQGRESKHKTSKLIN